MTSRSEANNRRRFQRFAYEATVRIYSGRAVWESQLIDISLKGMLLRRPTDWSGHSGDRYRVELQLAGGIFISMGILVAHVGSQRIGCQLDKIDIDSFSHLKRLIELNLGDARLLNRELSALG